MKRQVNTTLETELAERYAKTGLPWTYALAQGCRLALGEPIRQIDELKKEIHELKAKTVRMATLIAQLQETK